MAFRIEKFSNENAKVANKKVERTVAFVFDAGELHCSSFFLISSSSTFLALASVSRNWRYSFLFRVFFVLAICYERR